MEMHEKDDEFLVRIDPVALSRTVIRGRKTVFLFAGVLGVLTVVYAVLLPNRYSATVSIIPPSVSSPGFSSQLMASSLSGGLAGLSMLRNAGDLYSAVLRSRSLRDELITRFNLVSVYKVKSITDAEKRLSKATTIDMDPKSSVVTLSVEDVDPTRARDLANGYMQALRGTNGRLALTESAQRRAFYEQQLVAEKDKLADAEVALKQMQEQTGLVTAQGQTAADIQTITMTQAQLSAREVRLAALLQTSTEQNPDVVAVRSEIAKLHAQLAALQRSNGNGPGNMISLGQVPQKGLEVIRKQRDVLYHETLFEMLAKQYENARIDEARDAPVLQLLDPAVVPDRRSSPHRTLMVLGGLILGAFLGVFWVLVRDRLRSFVMQIRA